MAKQKWNKREHKHICHMQTLLVWEENLGKGVESEDKI